MIFRHHAKFILFCRLCNIQNIVCHRTYCSQLLHRFQKGAISAIGLNYKGGNNRDIECDRCSTLSEPLQNKHWGFPESFMCRW